MAKRVTETVAAAGSKEVPNNSASRKRIKLAAVGLGALVIWAIATAWGQMKGIDNGAERLNALDAKLEQTKQINEKLQKEIERMSDPEYREERIRKDMHLSKDGETVFDVPRSNP